MKKKTSMLLAGAACLSLFLTGCSQNNKTIHSDTTEQKTPSKEQTEHIVLNEVAHSIFYAPMYVAIEEDYFQENHIDLELVTGYGADKTMTAVLSGEADIGFMGSEASIYTYNGGSKDYVVNFAQLTQRAGNFLVAREEMPDFSWNDLKGKTILGGRKGVVH